MTIGPLGGLSLSLVLRVVSHAGRGTDKCRAAAIPLLRWYHARSAASWGQLRGWSRHVVTQTDVDQEAALQTVASGLLSYPNCGNKTVAV